MTRNKVDLTLLKRLIGEMEGHLNVAENILTDANPDVNELVVEADKAIGLAGGVMQEAMEVMVQIQELANTARASGNRTDLLDRILAPFKGSN